MGGAQDAFSKNLMSLSGRSIGEMTGLIDSGDGKLQMQQD
jgi:hypothetical protein